MTAWNPTCDRAYVIFPIRYVQYAYVILPYAYRTLTSLYDENKPMCKLLTTKVHESHHWMCHWFLQTQTTTRSQAVARIADRTASQHLWGSRDVIRHVTIRYPICQFLLVVLWTESLSPTVFEILGSKRNEVTSLTFQDHVTSSVMWPFDTPCAIFYWWSFRTKPLSITVSEIFNIECIGWHDLDTTSKQRSRSCMVINFCTNRFFIYDFL